MIEAIRNLFTSSGHEARMRKHVQATNPDATFAPAPGALPSAKLPPATMTSIPPSPRMFSVPGYTALGFFIGWSISYFMTTAAILSVESSGDPRIDAIVELPVMMTLPFAPGSVIGGITGGFVALLIVVAVNLVNWFRSRS